MQPESPAVARLLRSRGLRPTQARQLILSNLLGRTDHPSAEEIRQALARRGVAMSVATLYQNLKRLTGSGVVAGFAGEDGVMRYDANVEPHAHAVCRVCGRVADVEPGESQLKGLLAALARSARHYRDWQISTARVELHGLCPRCRGNA
ncbi:MAG: Fur family transcriptional regulator [bacterium]